MTSNIGKQIITIYILPNISRRNDNQTIKFGQLIEYNMINIFLSKSCRNWGRETSSRPFFFFFFFFFFEKVLHEGKASDQQLNFSIFWYFSTWTCNKNEPCRCSDCWPQDMLNFDFLEVLQYIPVLYYQEKYFSSCILSAHLILLSDCLYFFRYLATCAM